MTSADISSPRIRIRGGSSNDEIPCGPLSNEDSGSRESKMPRIQGSKDPSILYEFEIYN